MIVDKPWGKVATYALNQPSSVRLITVEPSHVTSVHYHRMRDEMWVVLDPGLTIEIGNRVVDAQPGEEFMVAGLKRFRILGINDDIAVQGLEELYERGINGIWIVEPV